MDNQEVIKYPVDFIVRNLKGFVDRIMLYGGDEISTEYMRSVPTPVPAGAENIYLKIKTPGDIPTALNECIARTINYYDPDFILTIEADLDLLPAGIQQYQKWMQNPTGDHANIRTQHVKMFIETFRSHWASSIIARHSECRYYGDGSFASDAAVIDKVNTGAIDIGYLSHRVWYAKNMQHQITWNHPRSITSLYKQDEPEFIRAIFESIKTQGPRGYIDPSHPHYSEVMDYYNAHSDFFLVKETLGDITPYLYTGIGT